MLLMSVVKHSISSPSRITSSISGGEFSSVDNTSSGFYEECYEVFRGDSVVSFTWLIFVEFFVSLESFARYALLPFSTTGSSVVLGFTSPYFSFKASLYSLR